MMFIAKVVKKSRCICRYSIVPFFKMCLYNTLYNVYIRLLGSKDKRNLNNYFSICLIFKNEAPFLKEWIDYHIAIGVSHFYLYNNNSTDNFSEVLAPYIASKQVTLIDWPEINSQFKAYRHCYDNYRNETNWLSFLDADEFICPKYKNSIIEWLQPFKKFPAVNVQWLMFTTGGLLKRDNKQYVIEQFRTCWNELSNHGKCFINTRYDIANFDSWYLHHHTYMYYNILGLKVVVPAVNQFGYICTIDKCWGGGKNKRSSSTIQINHYFTKSWFDWSLKMKGSDVLFKKNPKSDINYFFKYEMKSTSYDYTISRFLIKMKIQKENLFES